MKCKAMTKYGIHCRYNRALGDYCVMHWKVMRNKKVKNKKNGN